MVLPVCKTATPFTCFSTSPKDWPLDAWMAFALNSSLMVFTITSLFALTLTVSN